MLKPGSARRTRPTLRAAAAVIVILGTTWTSAGGAAAARWWPSSIVLPGARSAEGIALGRGTTFYAGELFTGDIYRGDLRRGTAAEVIDAPNGRQATGMKFDRRSGRLFVAGGFTGQGYVYDTRNGATVASFQFADPTPTASGPGSVVNDVILTREGAWFTDSRRPQLYFVPIGRKGALGPVRTVGLSGPAADTSQAFNLNGIAATADGKTLVVAHSGNAALYRVDPATGASTQITGVSVPNVDGIVLEGHRLWAVQNFLNRVSVVDLAPDLSSGQVVRTITSDLFQTPSTAARFGSRLALVNAKFHTGFPPTAPTFEVVVVGA